MYDPKINQKDMYGDITKNSLYALEKSLKTYNLESMPDAQYGGGNMDSNICNPGWLNL